MGTPSFSYFWGVAVPALIVIGSFAVTLWLYRVFSRHPREPEK